MHHLLAAAVALLGSVPSVPEPSLLPLPSAEAVADALKPREQPLVVHFWALWCPPCMEELPRVVELARKVRATGAEVLFISVDEKENALAIRQRLQALGAFEAARQAHMDMGVDANAVARLLDRRWDGSLPATFALHPRRKAPVAIFGELNAEGERKILEALKPARAGQPPRVPARTGRP
jgi:thiol-disulfide isomerase/thioredoxin